MALLLTIDHESGDFTDWGGAQPGAWIYPAASAPRIEAVNAFTVVDAPSGSPDAVGDKVLKYDGVSPVDLGSADGTQEWFHGPLLQFPSSLQYEIFFSFWLRCDGTDGVAGIHFINYTSRKPTYPGAAGTGTNEFTWAGEAYAYGSINPNNPGVWQPKMQAAGNTTGFATPMVTWSTGNVAVGDWKKMVGRIKVNHVDNASMVSDGATRGILMEAANDQCEGDVTWNSLDLGVSSGNGNDYHMGIGALSFAVGQAENSSGGYPGQQGGDFKAYNDNIQINTKAGSVYNDFPCLNDAFGEAVPSEGTTIYPAPEKLPHLFDWQDFPGMSERAARKLARKLNENFDSAERQLLALDPDQQQNRSGMH